MDSGFFSSPQLSVLLQLHIFAGKFFAPKKKVTSNFVSPLEENVEICGLLHWLNIKLLQLCLPLVLTNFIAFIFSVVGFKWRLHMLRNRRVFGDELAFFAAAVLHQILSCFMKEI